MKWWRSTCCWAGAEDVGGRWTRWSAIVDAGNLERNCTWSARSSNLGLPTVVALTWPTWPTAAASRIELAAAAAATGGADGGHASQPRRGVAELKAALAETIRRGPRPPRGALPEPFEREVAGWRRASRPRSAGRPLPGYLVERLLLDTGGYLQRALLPEGDGVAEQWPSRGDAWRRRAARCRASRRRPATAGPARRWTGVVSRPGRLEVTATDRIDRVAHPSRLWGIVVFALVMLLVFRRSSSGPGR